MALLRLRTLNHISSTTTSRWRHLSSASATKPPPLLYDHHSNSTTPTDTKESVTLQLFSWGRGASGQLGGGIEEIRIYPAPVATLSVPPNFSLSRAIPGRLPHSAISDRADVEVSISCGLFHSGLVVNGKVWIWGKGDGGRLGFGHENSVFVPTLNPHLESDVKSVALGGLHSVALDVAGRVFTWGYGGFGALGHSVYHRELLPKLVEGSWDGEICHIATSGTHTASITNSGFFPTLAAAASETARVVLPADSPYLSHILSFVPIPGAAEISFLSILSTRCNFMVPVVLLLDPPDLLASYLPTPQSRPFRPTSPFFFRRFTTISSPHHPVATLIWSLLWLLFGLSMAFLLLSAAILEDVEGSESGLRWCHRDVIHIEVEHIWGRVPSISEDEGDGKLHIWGRDEGDGRLGLGPGRGPDFAGGNSTPSEVKALPVPVAAVSCGGFFTMALTEEGQLWNWGANSNYELGRGDKIGGWKPQPVPSLKDVRLIQIASGGYHSLALTDKGEVLSWGHGGQGQLGNSSLHSRKVPEPVEALANERVTYIACGGSSSAAITDKGKLYMWGNTADSQLGVPGLPEVQPSPVEVNFLMEDDRLGNHNVLSVSVGASHAMCLVSRPGCL
ncbi:hypothetical protein BUALT_Bualt18G0008000 [Buddleja alternifolia]|uniref:RCC1-like domain-containing protein n=1 Tax=Buddleja alternifolia TaxID=168488 RepID=A0AAV6W2P1_9LAMI|nr:hypothetical protein BUALT_Bualt18G0008000 [Buddleja alternifolia]